MGSVVRRFSATLACSLLALFLAPDAGARRPTVPRTRTFAPVPTSRPEHVQPMAPGTSFRRLANGRIAWRAPEGSVRTPPTAAPSQTLGFDAILRLERTWPANPTGALGDSFFVTAVNSALAVYDRAGAPVWGPNPLGLLFPLPSGTEVFDPKVVYDQLRGQFVVVSLAVNEPREKSWILLIAIPDPAAGDIGTWCGALIEGDRSVGDGRQFADYPGLGYDRDHVAVTTNQFDFATDAYRGAQLISMRTREVYDCGRKLRVETIAGADTRNPDGSLAFTIQPATTVGSGNSLYLLSFQDDRADSVVLWRLRDSGGRLVLQNTAIRVSKVSIGPYGTQGGGSLSAPNTWWDPGDLRITNAFADLTRSRVYGAHVIARDLRPDTVTGDYVEAVIRWYEIEVAPELGRSRVKRTGTIGQAEADVGWPAIGTDGNGNVFVTYSRASAPLDEFLSAWVALVAPGRTAGGSTLLAAGSARMEAVPGPERWGYYAAISRDPVDPTLVVLVNQYAVTDGSGTTRDWQQTVHVVREA